MQISNETKVGALTIIAVTLLVLGYNFLKGTTISKKNDVLYAKFSDIGSLDIANPVKIKGYRIGSVYDITSKDKSVSEVIVAIVLQEKVQIPVNSKATIVNSLTGVSYINIIPGETSNYLKFGDTLSSIPTSDMLSKVMTNVDPLLISVKEGADTLKVLINAVNKVLDISTQSHLKSIIKELDASAKSLSFILNAEEGPLANTLNNTKKFSENLNNNNGNLNAIIENIKITSQQLASAKISATVDNLNKMVTDLNIITERLKTKEGTLGSLINDRELYNNLTETSKSLNTLIDDIKIHPKRYISFSVFGKRDKSDPLKKPLSDTLRP
jgi:phospholipid/cholesterol/gamma-HCH transport system substrate-binding protein